MQVTTHENWRWQPDRNICENLGDSNYRKNLCQKANSAIVKDVLDFCGSVDFRKGVKEAQLDIICGDQL